MTRLSDLPNGAHFVLLDGDPKAASAVAEEDLAPTKHGTVTAHNEDGTIRVAYRCGVSRAVLIDEDRFRKVAVE